jgi:hypothetical protein
VQPAQNDVQICMLKTSNSTLKIPRENFSPMQAFIYKARRASKKVALKNSVFKHVLTGKNRSFEQYQITRNIFTFGTLRHVPLVGSSQVTNVT